MFCTNCGRKIQTSTGVCPYCGEKQTRLEGGNGFWDIFKESNHDYGTKPVDTSKAVQEFPNGKERKFSHVKLSSCLSCVCVIMCCICVVFTFSMKTKADHDINSVRQEVEAMSMHYETVDSRISVLENETEEDEILSDFNTRDVADSAEIELITEEGTETETKEDSKSSSSSEINTATNKEGEQTDGR
jgi:hypothetical protein